MAKLQPGPQFWEERERRGRECMRVGNRATRSALEIVVAGSDIESEVRERALVDASHGEPNANKERAIRTLASSDQGISDTKLMDA